MSIFIGVAGGSCSGKTTFANEIVNTLSDEHAGIIYQDSYYVDQSHMFDHDGGRVNFDHPKALDFRLLLEHLILLKSGKSIEMPMYDFSTHTRKKNTQKFSQRKFVVIDGTLILTQPKIIEILDVSVFVSCGYNTRYQRRLKRDVVERGREEKGVKKQFENQVEPMHIEFVEPSKIFADHELLQDDVITDSKKIIKNFILDKF